MTEEQIVQNAHDYTYTNDHNWTWDDSGESRVDISTEVSDAHIAGAHSRDEEIRQLRSIIADQKYALNVCEIELAKLRRLRKLRNPWISVEDRKPTKPTLKEGIKQTLIAYWDGTWIFEVMYYEDADEAWRIEGQDWMPEYQYWMPIEQPKGIKQ